MKKLMSHKLASAFFFVALWLTTGLCLTSCTSIKSQNNLKPVYITNSKKINLLATDNVSNPIDEVQLLNGRFGDTAFSLMCYTQIDSQQISLSLFNDFGTDMGNLYYDGSMVTFDSAFFPKNLPGEYIISDIQNAFYDSEVLKQNYAKSRLSFESNMAVQREADDTETFYTVRRVLDGKKLIEEITILNNTITIKNFLREYEYQLIKAEE